MQKVVQEQRELFEGLAAAYILGAEPDLEKSFQNRFLGDPRIFEVCLSALKASKLLYETLKSQTTTEKQVLNSIETKKQAALEFKRVMKYPWPF